MRVRILNINGNDTMKIRKAVLPAAGLGTRFLPATKAQPKEMLPLVDKPLVQYAVEEASASGIKDFVFVIGAGKNSVQQHFQKSALEQLLRERKREDLLEMLNSVNTLAQRASYVYQWTPLGLGDAILKAYSEVGKEPFAVLLPDDVIDSHVPCIKQLMDVHARYKHSVFAIQRVEGEAISSYGVIKGRKVRDYKGGRLYRIENLVEKPNLSDAPSDLAIIGRYILSPSIFEHLNVTFPGAGGEIQLTDALRRMLEDEPIYGYLFEGQRHDAGDKLGFLKATVEMALKSPELGQAFRNYLRSDRIKKLVTPDGDDH